MAYRYSIGGKIYTTDLVWRQHWESPAQGFPIMLAATKDLGAVPQDFHDSLIDISETEGKAVAAVNYALDAQERLSRVEAKLDRLLSQ